MRKTILCLIFAAGIALRVGVPEVPSYRADYDEGYYLRYASYLANEEGASLTKLSDSYIHNKAWHLFPNPLRAGYILLSAWWMKLLNRFDFAALSYLSTLFSICSLFIGYLFAKRLFGEHIALVSLILFVASPINLALGRRALQDSAVYFFTITAVYLFYKMLADPGLRSRIVFGLSFFIAIAVKETSLLLCAFFVPFILLEKKIFDQELRTGPLFVTVGLVLAAAFGMYLGIAGGAGKLFQMARIIILSPLSNQYAIQYQSGNALRYLGDFLMLSPATLILGLAFFVLSIKDRDFHDRNYFFLAAFFVLYYAAFSLFSKNARYVMALDLPIRIFTASLICLAFGTITRTRRVAALAIALSIAVTDLFVFRHIFIVHNIYDPVTNNLGWAWAQWFVK